MFRLKIQLFSALILICQIATAHTIGGAYAMLVKCEWGQYGYEYGNIGTYEVNGQVIKQFFGSNYCPA